MNDVRPTSGTTLQALFNILGPMRGQSFLDLFSGTGRVAMKAWQSGAEPVVAVETLRNRCGEIPARGRGTECPLVLFMDVRRALKWPRHREYRFDVIFADPPYLSGWMHILVPLLEENRDLLIPGGVIVLEHSMREPLPDLGNTFDHEERKYGETTLSFLRFQEPLTERRESE